MAFQFFNCLGLLCILAPVSLSSGISYLLSCSGSFQLLSCLLFSPFLSSLWGSNEAGLLLGNGACLLLGNGAGWAMELDCGWAMELVCF